MYPLVLKIAASLAVGGAVTILKTKVRNPESLAFLLILAAGSGMAKLLIDREIDSAFATTTVVNPN